jgi:hypothetical protein
MYGLSSVKFIAMVSEKTIIFIHIVLYVKALSWVAAMLSFFICIKKHDRQSIMHIDWLSFRVALLKNY